jgi:site-specific DNA-cytosine methylase
MIAATLFSGGGLADIGLKAAGYDPVWAIEYHQPAAEIYRANFNHDSLQDLLTADPRNYLSPDYLHLSSPCQSFSGANTSGGEKSNDLLLVNPSAVRIPAVVKNPTIYCWSKNVLILFVGINHQNY